MNRPIKFRAWRKSSNEMLPWEYIENTRALYALNHDDDSIYMQFTGLHDRNGVPIYEGDILGYGKDNKRKIIVYWADEGAEWCGRFTFDSPFPEADQISRYELDKTEVIGNIYQNPELMKG